MPQVAAIVRCGDLVRHVYSTLVSVERQTLTDLEIVLVTDETTPGAARPWLNAIAQQRAARLLESPAPLPGAIRNAGIQATTAPLVVCLNAGDSLAPRYFESAAARLASDPGVGIVSSPVQFVGVAEANRTIGEGAPDLVDLLGSADAVHSASMFRRAAWVTLDAFDESLTALEDYDFWLRVAAAGGSCSWVDEPSLVRQLRKDSHWYRDRDDEKYLCAMTAILQKQDALFRDRAAAVLYARERLLTGIGQRYRQLIAVRDEGVAEIERLKRRAAGLRASPPVAGDDQPGEDFRRTTPVDREWGYSRGAPVDRHYIEQFVQAHAADVAGAVLEIQEPDYTRRFGGARVTRSDVVDLDPANPRATILTDLRNAANIPNDRYDCIILTQTLHVLDDVVAAVRECHRILRPHGVLLATFPCASRLCLEYGPNGDFWRVTEAGARAWLESCFPPAAIDIRSFGNVLSNTAFLYGLGSHELDTGELDAHDPFFPMLVGVRARKAFSTASAPRSIAASAHAAGAVLLYHRVAEAAGDVHELAVSPSAFHDQMAYVRQHCHPLPLDELVTRAQQGSLPPRAVAITFDDGYLDNSTAARPILDQLEIPATFFVTTDRLEEQREFWWDVLAASLLADAPERPPELRIDLPDGPQLLRTDSAPDRLAAHWTLYHAIVALPAAARDDVVDRVCRWSGASAGGADAVRMGGAGMRELAGNSRYRIGAHSVRHEMLPRQPSQVQERDAVESRQTLEQWLGRQVTAFAYPYGAHNAETIEAVRSAGFDIAVTCDEMCVGADSDPLRVPRYMVTHARAARFPDWLDSILRPR